MDNKNLRIGLVALGAFFVAYLAVCLLVFEKTATFWMQICFTTIAFVLSGIAIKGPSKHFFLNLSTYAVASSYLVLQVVISLVSMALQAYGELWSYIASITLLALYIGVFATTQAAVRHANVVDAEVDGQTEFMSHLTVRLEWLRDMSPIHQRADIEKALETARYSVLRSCDATREIETVLRFSLDELQSAVDANDGVVVKRICVELERLIKQRNRICRQKAKGRTA